MHNFQGYLARTFQDLKLQFLGLYRTKVLFQDFPGGVGTLCMVSPVVPSIQANDDWM